MKMNKTYFQQNPCILFEVLRFETKRPAQAHESYSARRKTDLF